LGELGAILLGKYFYSVALKIFSATYQLQIDFDYSIFLPQSEYLKLTY